MFKLRDYQVEKAVEGFEILKKYKLVYLSFEVRCGKTLTSLQTSKLYGAKNVLFLTKKKAINSIKNDYEMLSPGYDITVINYESVHKIEGTFDLIILDEAHGLGAFPKPAKRVKDLKKLCYRKPIIYLSGTPTPESYSQIYHQLSLSSYSPFSDYSNFYKWSYDYVIVSHKMIYGKPINDYSNAIKEKIDSHTKHLFISFTQKESGFEQTINEQIVYCEMKPITKKLIETLKNDLVIEGENDVVLADTAVKLQNKIHQLSSGTVKTEEGNYVVIDDSKAQFIKQKFKGQKIAIFYKFKAEYKMLKEVFTNFTESPEEFADNDDLVFLSQIQSGREGISLKTADSLIFFNIDFSSVSYFQARDRLTAKDRTKDNNVYWIFSKGGIEGKIYKAVSKKQDYTKSYFMKDYGIESSKFN